MEEVKQKNFTKKEILVNLGAVFALSLLAIFFSLLIPKEPELKDIIREDGKLLFTLNLSLIWPSILTSVVTGISLVLINLSFVTTDEQPDFKSVKRMVSFGLLVILGLFAHLVLLELIDIYLHLSPWINFFISTFIYLCYLYVMYKLYVLKFIDSKLILYELIRFALVGVIAALFDFVTCYLFQYIFLPQTWSEIALTSLSVTMGFIIGVTVNYLCSVYMVYKSTTDKDKSKTPLGIVLFVVLSAVGLFIGIGLQYLFYDFLELNYVLTFIIRTLVVLVWNYISRKKLIFK